MPGEHAILFRCLFPGETTLSANGNNLGVRRLDLHAFGLS
jgi:hypothetical protein